MLNKICIEGRLTRDPEGSFTKNGKAMCKMSIAVNSGYGDNEHVSFLDVTIWGKTAENSCKYLRKGSHVNIDGE